MGKYEFEGENLNFVSEDAKDLISKCLNSDPAQRISPSDALAHPWIVNRKKSKIFLLTYAFLS